MIKTINSKYEKRGKVYEIIEIHRDGYKVIAFGKRKAQAIIEAIRDTEALHSIEKFAGYHEPNTNGAWLPEEAARATHIAQAQSSTDMKEDAA